jgi:peptidoglycan/xylan/chitin deacetylase (PgdA/CDA1 family)
MRKAACFTIIFIFAIAIFPKTSGVRGITQAEAPTDRIAYLTFDDGPSANTEVILKILKEYNIKATFFVVRREKYSYLYKRIIEEGHTLGGHSSSHVYKNIYKCADSYYKDINSLNKYVYSCTGEKFEIIRFPGGSNNTISERYGGSGIMSTITSLAESKGYEYYDWNVCPIGTSSKEIASDVEVQCKYKKSAVILLHDAPNDIETVQAIREIINNLHIQGYKFKRIDKDTPVVKFI